MEKSTRRSLPVILFIALVAVQFVPVPRSNPPVEAEIPAPAPVLAVLKRACYDCHSHETTWPWYSRVAPASWVVAYDVWQGRAELNFSAWSRSDARRQEKTIREIWKEVADGDMPPWSYRVVHPDAALSPGDRQTLREWAERVPPGGVGMSR